MTWINSIFLFLFFSFFLSAAQISVDANIGFILWFIPTWIFVKYNPAEDMMVAIANANSNKGI